MSIFIPKRRRFDIVNTYINLDAPRVIATGNPTRGLFLLIVTDSFDATRPRRWEIMVSGGFKYVGDESKYFLIKNSSVNVASFGPHNNDDANFGFEYDLTDAFGNTYHLIFNGRMGFDPSIERTAGAALTGPVELRSILFAFA